jgi:hypothetical protein
VDHLGKAELCHFDVSLVALLQVLGMLVWTLSAPDSEDNHLHQPKYDLD